jgi:hypothetical protein
MPKCGPYKDDDYDDSTELDDYDDDIVEEEEIEEEEDDEPTPFNKIRSRGIDSDLSYLIPRF